MPTPESTDDDFIQHLDDDFIRQLIKQVELWCLRRGRDLDPGDIIVAVLEAWKYRPSNLMFPQAYLRTIVVNTINREIAKLMKERKKLSHHDDKFFSQFAGEEESRVNLATSPRFWSAFHEIVENLNSVSRRIFDLRAVGRHTFSDIAMELGMPTVTVHRIYHKVIHQLKTKLEPLLD